MEGVPCGTELTPRGSHYMAGVRGSRGYASYLTSLGLALRDLIPSPVLRIFELGLEQYAHALADRRDLSESRGLDDPPAQAVDLEARDPPVRRSLDLRPGSRQAVWPMADQKQPPNFLPHLHAGGLNRPFAMPSTVCALRSTKLRKMIGILLARGWLIHLVLLSLWTNRSRKRPLP